MGDYIEREAAIAEFSNNGSAFVYGEKRCKAIVSRLNTIPAADVRPVVLCRDCDYWDEWDRAGDTCSCAIWSEDRLIYTKEEEFCSWGRKRGVAE